MGTGEEIHTERDHGAWSSGRTETRLQMLAAWVPAQGPEDADGRQAAMAQVMRPGYLSPDLGTPSKGRRLLVWRANIASPDKSKWLRVEPTVESSAQSPAGNPDPTHCQREKNSLAKGHEWVEERMWFQGHAPAAKQACMGIKIG